MRPPAAKVDFRHISSAERVTAMRTLAGRLAPSGLIDVFEHNPVNPATRRIVDHCPFDAYAVLLKPRELYARAKLSLQWQTYCLFLPLRLPWLLPAGQWLGWLPPGGQYWVRAPRSS